MFGGPTMAPAHSKMGRDKEETWSSATHFKHTSVVDTQEKKSTSFLTVILYFRGAFDVASGYRQAKHPESRLKLARHN
ncbi:hypothetical protein ACLOJK_039514 [Asimina triloba]